MREKPRRGKGQFPDSRLAIRETQDFETHLRVISPEFRVASPESRVPINSSFFCKQIIRARKRRI